jgi:hypothetical protein
MPNASRSSRSALPAWLAATTLAITGPAFAASWHVDNMQGDDAHDGRSQTTAFATVRRAVESCEPGDVLVIAPTGQPYHQTLNITGRSGTPDRPIVIEGNGAVLSGFADLTAGKWQARNAGRWFLEFRRPPQNPYLRLDGRRVDPSRDEAGLQPGQFAWTDAGIHLCLPDGAQPAQRRIEATVLGSGLVLHDASYIVCRNLVIEGFSNDGFNFHGDCQGIVCQSIEARHNGDDGFSIHEDISAVVMDGWFHHNNYGIQDVNAGRSSYFGVRVEHNRVAGVDFHGGVHMLTDAVVRNNAGPQVRVNASPAEHIGLVAGNPALTGLCLLKNVLIDGGVTGLEVAGTAHASASNCVLRNAATGVLVASDAVCHLTASVIHGCRDLEVAAGSATVVLNRNVYHPGRFRWGAVTYEPQQWQEYRDATRQDVSSRVGEPSFGPGGMLEAPLPDPLPRARQLRPGLTTPLITESSP